MNFENNKIATEEEAGLFALCNKDNMESLYTETWCFEIDTSISVSDLEFGIIEFMKNADGLRMNFFSEDGDIRKRYNDSNPVLVNMTSDEKSLEMLINEFKNHKYDLAKDLLVEFCIFHDLENSCLYLLINSHHIVTDAWTKNLILSEVMTLSKGGKPRDKSEYSEGIERKVPDKIKQEFKVYQEKAKNYPSRVDKFSNHNVKNSGYSLTFFLNKVDVSRLTKIAYENKVSLFSYLLSLFYVYTCSFSKESNFNIGIPFAKRLSKDDEERLGYFVKILPFYLETEFENLVDDTHLYFRETQKLLLKLSSYLPLDVSRDIDINTVFSFQETEKIEGITRELFLSQNGAKFELTVNFKKSFEVMSCEFEFSDEVWSEYSSKEFFEGFCEFIRSVIENSNLQILDNIASIERNRSQSIISGPPKSTDNNIYDRFRRINKNSSKVAIIENDKAISYRELDKKVNDFSRALNIVNLENKIVCLQLSRSINSIALILALAKNNVPHVNLSKLYPEERIKFIISNSGAELYISDQDIPDYININSFLISELLNIEKNNDTHCKFIAVDDKIIKNSDNKVFEIIYTSGTTGKPKGVKITQQNILNFIANFDRFSLKSEDIFTHSTSYTFDAWFFEVWMPLLNNASIYVIKDPITELSNWNFTESLYKPSVSFFTTSLFNLLVNNGFIKELNSIDRIYTGGEVASERFINKAINEYGKKIINVYGPTENTCITTTMLLDKPIKEEIPLGEVITNTVVGVINSNNEFVPRDMFGEIVISSDSLMEGYYHDEERTQENIVYLTTITGRVEKFYKTGDIGRISHDSLLYYKSRKDRQVKIRGFRVELSEIENQVMKVDGVNKCLVEFNKNHLNRTLSLVYEGSILSKDLREYLVNILPSYMVPNEIKHVSELKLNINGKIDQSLAYVEEIKETYHINNEKDITNLEETVIEAIKETLHIPFISRDVDFYELGIDSIVSIQLCSYLNNRGVFVKVSDIFNYPTLGLLLERIQHIQKLNNKSENLDLWQKNKLSPIQKWFFRTQHESKTLNQFNQTFLMKLNEDINQTEALRALREVVDTFPIFNTYFSMRKNKRWYQIMKDKDSFKYFIETYTVKNQYDFQQLLVTLQSSLDISKKLYNFCLINFNGECYLFFVVHHLIIDGVSWRILLDSFSRKLTAKKEKFDIIAAPNFSEWVRFIEDYNVTEEVSEYWSSFGLEKLKSNIRFSEVDYDELEFSLEETKRFKEIVNESYFADMESCLLTLISTAYYQCFTSKPLVKIEGHGRHWHAEQFNDSLGWFTSIYPFRSKINNNLKDSIIENHNSLSSVPNKGFDFQLVNDLDFAADFSFNFMGEFYSKSFKKFEICSMFRKDDFGSDLLFTDRMSFVPIIIDGKLQLRVSYGKSLINKTTIKQLLDSFTNILSNFIKESHSQYLPTTSLQNSLLLRNASEGDDGSYVIQWSGYFKEFDFSKFHKSLNKLVRSTDTLRSVFEFIGSNTVQIIKKPEEFFVNSYTKVLDWSIYSKAESEEKLASYLNHNRTKSFDLNKGPLFRITVIILHVGYYLVIEHHHIILDGWSIPILLKNLSNFYCETSVDSQSNNKQSNISATYRYIEKKKKVLDSSVYRKIFEDYSPVEFYGQKGEKSGQYQYMGHLKNSDKLKLFLKEHQITLNEFFLSIWIIALSFTFGREDILLGVSVSGRSTFPISILNSIGMFVTTLPFRIKNVDSNTSISKIFKEVQIQSSQMQDNDLLSWSELALQNSFNEEIQFGYVFENYPIGNNDEFFAFTKFKGEERVDFPLALSVTDSISRIDYELHYKVELFSEDMIHGVSSLLENITKLLLENDFSLINDLKDCVIKNRKLYPQSFDKDLKVKEDSSDNLISLFKKYESRIFIKRFNSEITYKDTFSKVQNIIDRTNLKESDIVGILSRDRYIQTLLAISCFVSGATYVPLDNSMSSERIKFIIEDSCINCIFTDEGEFQRLNDSSTFLNCTDIAYIIYTSGTTGNPKGVKVSKENILSTIENLKIQNILNEEDIIYQNISMIFDPSIMDILYPIAVGASIYIPQQRLYGQELEEILEEEKITAITMTPSLLRVSNFSKNNYLKKIIVGGERLSQGDLEHVSDRIKIYNEYGPTEVSIVSSIFTIDENNRTKHNYYPIGKGFNNMNYYVKSKQGYKLPYYIPGELVIEGSQVSKGYTQELLNGGVFDFSGNFPKYFTGDICYIEKSGNIVFLGRNDRQVKIRGFRIELEEIEKVVKAIEGIQLCQVLVDDNKTKLFLAYIGNVSEVKVNEILSKRLPNYMIPQHIRKFSNFPLLTSGKTDFKSLLASFGENTDTTFEVSDDKDSEVKNNIEKLLVDTLDIKEQFNCKSNFFELGGTSLLAVKFIRGVNDNLNINLKINTLFESESIENFIEKVEDFIDGDGV